VLESAEWRYNLPEPSPKEPGFHPVMDRWLGILKDEPSRVAAPILYHYTDAFGVSGIISSNSLWATATQFSNDVSEIEYSVAVAMRVIQETWKTTIGLNPWERILVEHLVHLFRTPLHSFGQPFIVSFCEAGDLLSQWRGYGQSSGFSLAFKSLNHDDKLKLVCQDGFRTRITRLIYEPNKQRARLRFLLRRLIKLVNGFAFKVASTEGTSVHVELSLILVLAMTDWACSVKHASFSEEREWRIVTYPKGATLSGARPENYEGVSVRPTTRLLLPYMTLEPLPGQRLPLLEVRCGPSQFQEQSSRAMHILLRNHGYANLPVTLSSVPLRT
jgi:hypothetical protein